MRKSVTWGLFAAWLANDVEEWFTIPRWVRRTHPELPVPPAHTRTAIPLMGLVMLAASARGAVTGGRSPFFQSALAGFGLHGVGHLLLSAAHRGYTPGVATAPTVVLPFAVWAWRELGRAGVRQEGSGAWRDGALLLPVTLAAVHGAAYAARAVPSAIRRSRLA